jgi:uncharacterized membrane protein (UPF0127 family)
MLPNSQGTKLALLKKASNWWSKGIGLLGQRTLEPGHGIWLPGISSVHTVFMMFPIDIIFLGQDFKVLKIAKSVAPGALSVHCSGAANIIELRGGTLADHSLAIGDTCKILKGTNKELQLFRL